MPVLAEEAVLQCLGDPILPTLQRDLQTSQEVFMNMSWEPQEATSPAHPPTNMI